MKTATALNLRPYQQRTAEHVRSLSRGSRACIQSPTGSGKSIIMADLLKDPMPQIVLTHRRVLLDQLANHLTNFGIDFGFRAADKPLKASAPIQLAMLQTEYSKAHKGKKWQMCPAERVHVDEVHAQKANTAQVVIQNYVDKGATLVGWTATPSEVHTVCDSIHVACTVQDLIDTDYLVPPLVFTPDGPDTRRLENVKRQLNGEFSQTELAKVWKPRVVLARVLEYYRRLTDGHAAVLFAQGVPEALFFAEEFSRVGVPSAMIAGDRIWVDGSEYDSSTELRDEIFERLEEGDLKLLTNRFVLREGWDCPTVRHVILATAFGSRAAFIQACGRGLRPFAGKEHCVFQDHGGNFWRHPQLNEDIPWILGDTERIAAMVRQEEARNGEIPDPIVCPNCAFMRVSGKQCPNCGHMHHSRSRPVMQIDGSLHMMTGPLYRPRRIRPAPGDDKMWAQAYWAAKKNRPSRTFAQIYAWIAYNNNWRWLSRDLPLMPTTERGWFIPVGEVPTKELRR